MSPKKWNQLEIENSGYPLTAILRAYSQSHEMHGIEAIKSFLLYMLVFITVMNSWKKITWKAVSCLWFQFIVRWLHFFWAWDETDKMHEGNMEQSYLLYGHQKLERDKEEAREKFYSSKSHP